MLYCYLCNDYYPTFNLMIFHLKNTHIVLENKNGLAKIKCVKSELCKEKFNTFDEMRKHCQKCNKQSLVPTEIEREVDSDRGGEASAIEEIIIEETDHEPSGTPSFFENNDTGNTTPDDIFFKLNIALNLFFKILISNSLSRSLMALIVIELQVLLYALSDLLIAFLKQRIDNFEGTEIGEVIELFFENIINILRKYQTTYLSKQQIQRSGNYVAPAPKLLGRRWDHCYNRITGNYEKVFKICEFQYVSIVETLTNLFKNSSFKDAFFSNSHTCVDGTYEKFCCGEIFKNSEFFQENPNAIRIQIYYDDFTLSSNSKSQPTVKLGGVYFTIENLPRHLNSHIDNIHLIGLFHTQDLKNFGQNYNKILLPIIEDLIHLDNIGIKLDNNQVLKGALINHPADNLGTRTIFGMFESFRSTFHCAHCKMSIECCEKSFEEDITLFRTETEYRQLFQESKLKEFAKSKMAHGIMRYTFLDRVPNFSIFKNMIVDMMHDLAEGIIPFVMRCYFEFGIKSGVFDLAKINDKILNFDFGFVEHNNIPGEITISKHLNLTASQKIVLFLHFPIIFWEYRNDYRLKQYWLAITTLVGITKICLSTKLSVEDLNRLQVLIKEHLKEIVNTYKQNLLPKHHYLTHYLGVIRSHGPPTTFWTMR